MADKMIGELPLAPQVTDSALLAVEQSGTAMKMTGAQFKEFAKDSVKGYIDDAQKIVDEVKDYAEDAEQSAQEAKEYSGKPPVIQNDTWWIWNAKTQQYVDTGLPSKGNVMYATFYLDVDTGELWMLYDEDYTGPEFSVNKDTGLLVVHIP